jgi:hypothetical protein
LLQNPTNHLRESRNCIPWKVGVPDGSSERKEFVCLKRITGAAGFVNMQQHGR